MNNNQIKLSDQEIIKIKKSGFALLKKHNNVKQKTKRRLITKEDEGFLSGCKGNTSYYFQKELSPKQLLKMKGVVQKYKDLLEKSLPKVKIKPDSLFVDKPTKIPERKLSPRLQKLKELVLKIK